MNFLGLYRFLAAFVFVSLPCFASAQIPAVKCSALLETVTYRIQDDLADTLVSLESMRGEAGLLADTVHVTNGSGKSQVFILNPDTSPTNIALDLLIHTELFKSESQAGVTIQKLLKTLSQLDYHKDTGLFFSRYSSADGGVRDRSVSSIDNLHLALALWTLAEEYPSFPAGHQARWLFERMNFSDFVDEESSLIGGNLRPAGNSWTRDAYNFAHLGSEARALYSAGWALGLFRSHTGREFVDLALAALDLEILESQAGPLMKLWDGAAFQLYFPQVLIGEEHYSEILESVFESMTKYMILEGDRRGLVSPAAHSATRATLKESAARPAYQDKSGIKDLVSAQNRDLKDPRLAKYWDSLFAPHVIYMAALSDRSLLNTLTPLKQIRSGENALYVPGLGWMDALHVSGRSAGEVVPVQLSLNQGFLALSALALRSADGLTSSARALHQNPLVWERLQYFYGQFDEKWKATRQLSAPTL